MDSLTQIVLGAGVAEAVAGKKMGNKAVLWGAVAGTIPDLDVFLRFFYHPIDAALVHRGFSHSLLFALLMGPLLGFVFFKLYKQKYELKTWIWLFFLGIVTHPILDMFTNYGTQFLWPFNFRITFNSVFVIDPLYTIPFMVCIIVAMTMNRENPKRKKWNLFGIYYSTSYLLYGVIVKLIILSNATAYFQKDNRNVKNPMVTPMPMTSFYWMILTEDDSNYYVGYKSLFYEFNPADIDTVKKDKQALYNLKWKGKNYAKQLDFISNGYYTTELKNDTLRFYDMRFGLTSKLSNQQVNIPVKSFTMVIDNNTVQKTFETFSKDLFKKVTFGKYIHKIISNE